MSSNALALNEIRTALRFCVALALFATGALYSHMRVRVPPPPPKHRDTHTHAHQIAFFQNFPVAIVLVAAGAAGDYSEYLAAVIHQSHRDVRGGVYVECDHKASAFAECRCPGHLARLGKRA